MRSRTQFARTALFSIAGLALFSIVEAREWLEDRTITQVSEHVYRWGSDNQYGAFILTDDGIIVRGWTLLRVGEPRSGSSRSWIGVTTYRFATSF